MPKDKLIVRGFIVSNNQKYVLVGEPVINEYGILDFKNSKLISLNEYNSTYVYEHIYNEPASITKNKVRKRINEQYNMPYLGFEAH